MKFTYNYRDSVKPIQHPLSVLGIQVTQMTVPQSIRGHSLTEL